jgi:hypothetical protein
MDVILCHKKLYTSYAYKRHGWLIGVNSGFVSNNNYKQDDTIHFLDYPFKSGDNYWQEHYNWAKHYRPKYAVCPDVVDVSRLQDYLDFAHKLAQVADKVIVVPKVHNIIDKIPKQFIIGYSVPTKYGKTIVLPLEIGNRPVHLLGGGHKKLIRLMQYLNVVSFDSNGFIKGCHRGGWYHVYQNGKLINIRSNYQHKADDRVLLSIDALGRFWNDYQMGNNRGH